MHSCIENCTSVDLLSLQRLSHFVFHFLVSILNERARTPIIILTTIILFVKNILNYRSVGKCNKWTIRPCHNDRRWCVAAHWQPYWLMLSGHTAEAIRLRRRWEVMEAVSRKGVMNGHHLVLWMVVDIDQQVCGAQRCIFVGRGMPWNNHTQNAWEGREIQMCLNLKIQMLRWRAPLQIYVNLLVQS